MATTKLFTAEDLLLMPSDAPYELIRGELHEVSPSGIEASRIAQWIGVRLAPFVRTAGLGLVTGADGGFILFREPDTLVAPDLAFIRSHRLPKEFDQRGFCPVPPDLAVEVLSPTNRPGKVAEKVQLYLDAGTTLVWVVDPRRRSVTVHRTGRPPQEFVEGDELDGEEILPGFRLTVSEIFA